MKTTASTCALIVALALSAGCVTSAPRGPRVEFDDIPMPTNLTYLDDRAVIIESPGVKAARLVYRGRVSMASLIPAMRGMMEANGWRQTNSTTAPPVGTIQMYEKGRDTVQLRLWENMMFTYVEVTTSRLGPTVSRGPADADVTPAATPATAAPVTPPR
jgi:hypothetical protein